MTSDESAMLVEWRMSAAACVERRWEAIRRGRSELGEELGRGSGVDWG
jgi:hypothetical protein